MELDKNKLHELEILKQVDKSPRLNNRMVAAKLDCSVKLAHSLLKKMVQKGVLEVRKLNSRRWDYYLTPHGISEKARLTYEFLDFSMHFYKEARKKSSQVCKDILDGGIKKISFIGSGDLAEICYLGVKEWGLELVNVYDSTDKKKFMGVQIRSFNELVKELDTHNSLNLIICLYDKGNPMTENYLPQEINNSSAVNCSFQTTNNQQPLTNINFYWIF